MNSYKTIAILMATFNGEKYLAEQIDSLLAQTYQDWHLYIHDDGSKDKTIDIINAYIGKYPDRITLLEYPSQGSACRNFLSMLERVEAPYYMFCDQDDIWISDKIEKSMQAIQTVEKRYGDIPVVVHTDLRIIDCNKNILRESFFNFANIHPERIKHYQEYVQNVVTGSTMLFNRKARASSLRVSACSATMHDAWVTLRAVADGGVRFTIFEPLVCYRQHAENVLGAQDGRRFTLSYRLSHFSEMLKMNIDHFWMMRSAGQIGLHTFIKNKYLVFKNSKQE